MDNATSTARKRHALELFSGLPSRYDRMGALLSLGQDPRWRRALVAWVAAERGDRVLDVATGTGLVAVALAERYDCAVVGLDQSEAMLAAADAKIAARTVGAGRIELVRGEAERLPFPDQAFDALTFTYLLRYVDDAGAVMRELARVVRPGGRIVSLEFGVPPARIARALWRGYTGFALGAAGRLASRQWHEVGRFLGPSIRAFDARYPPAALRRLWADAGIEVVATRRMSFGAGVVTCGVRDVGA